MKRLDKLTRRKPRSASRRWGSLVSAAALLAMAGCQNGYGSKSDPLFGSQRPQMQAPPTGQAASNVPPVPATHSGTTPAAMAGGATPTPDNPRDLRMDVAPIVPTSQQGGGAVRGLAPSPVQLGDPQPAPEATSSNVKPIADPSFQRASAASGASLAPTGSLTFEQVQQYLKQRGVVWQRLETVGNQGQWKFQCSLPLPGGKNMNRTYMTDGPLPTDPLTAVRAVLDKIEKDQH
jgi:hypothetical protein